MRQEWRVDRQVRAKRTLFGWHNARTGEFRLSNYPPDAPVRPSIALASKEDVLALAERRRAQVLWYPPLPADEVLNGQP